MVAPGQVDDSLEDEVAEESTRFGPVARVTIFEVTTAGYPVEEAVRIFVEFRDKVCIRTGKKKKRKKEQVHEEEFL